MDLLIYLGCFLAGLAVGYIWALFEIWIDKREDRPTSVENAGREDSKPLT